MLTAEQCREWLNEAEIALRPWSDIPEGSPHAPYRLVALAEILSYIADRNQALLSLSHAKQFRLRYLTDPLLADLDDLITVRQKEMLYFLVAANQLNRLFELSRSALSTEELQILLQLLFTAQAYARYLFLYTDHDGYYVHYTRENLSDDALGLFQMWHAINPYMGGTAITRIRQGFFDGLLHVPLRGIVVLMLLLLGPKRAAQFLGMQPLFDFIGPWGQLMVWGFAYLAVGQAGYLHGRSLLTAINQRVRNQRAQINQQNDGDEIETRLLPSVYEQRIHQHAFAQDEGMQAFLAGIIGHASGTYCDRVILSVQEGARATQSQHAAGVMGDVHFQIPSPCALVGITAAREKVRNTNAQEREATARTLGMPWRDRLRPEATVPSANLLREAYDVALNKEWKRSRSIVSTFNTQHMQIWYCSVDDKGQFIFTLKVSYGTSINRLRIDTTGIYQELQSYLGSPEHSAHFASVGDISIRTQTVPNMDAIAGLPQAKLCSVVIHFMETLTADVARVQRELEQLSVAFNRIAKAHADLEDNHAKYIANEATMRKEHKLGPREQETLAERIAFIHGLYNEVVKQNSAFLAVKASCDSLDQPSETSHQLKELGEMLKQLHEQISNERTSIAALTKQCDQLSSRSDEAEVVAISKRLENLARRLSAGLESHQSILRISPAVRAQEQYAAAPPKARSLSIAVERVSDLARADAGSSADAAGEPARAEPAASAAPARASAAAESSSLRKRRA